MLVTTDLNNILINHHSFTESIPIDAASLTGFVSDYNVLVNRLSDDDGNSNMTLSQWQSLGYDLHSMIADPENQIFVDHTNSNFHLLQNAQAVDSGTNLVLPTVFEDLDNIPRPQGSGFDIGCYEYTGTTEVVEENITQSFQLFQNYPNPFNPSTKISWQSTVGSWQTLKVYDVSGNEVAVLVDEYKLAGSYEVTFDSHSGKARNLPAGRKGLPSGVYFYQLKVGTITQTKSMILIK